MSKFFGKNVGSTEGTKHAVKKLGKTCIGIPYKEDT
jgi:hypothetical protein